MISTDDIQHLLVSGGTVVGTDGDKIGKIGQLFLDDRTGDPEWVTVTTGLFGRAESFVPLASATVQGDEIVVPYDKSKVKGAPRVEDSEGHLSPDEERELYRYYGFDEGSDADHRDGDRDVDHDRTGEAAAAGVAGTGDRDGDDRDADDRGTGDRAGRDDTRGDVGNGTDTGGRHAADTPVDAPGALGTTADGTAPAERPATGADTLATGGARLRRYVVTEEQTITVPVTREEVRIEPAPDADGTTGDGR